MVKFNHKSMALSYVTWNDVCSMLQSDISCEYWKYFYGGWKLTSSSEEATIPPPPPPPPQQTTFHPQPTTPTPHTTILRPHHHPHNHPSLTPTLLYTHGRTLTHDTLPVRRQAFAWTYADLFSNRPLEINFIKTWIKMKKKSLKKSSTIWRPLCSGDMS